MILWFLHKFLRMKKYISGKDKKVKEKL